MDSAKPQVHRKLLNRLLRAEDIRRDMSALDERMASHVVAALQQHESPMSALFEIRRHKDKHMVRTIFTLGCSPSFMDSVVVPFLAWLGQDALSKGTCKQCQQAIANDLARAPGLLEALLDALRNDDISDEMATLWFMGRLLLDDGQAGTDARKCELHLNLIKQLTHSLDLAVSKQARMLVDGVLNPMGIGKSGGQDASSAVADVKGPDGKGRSLDAIREAQPGGRHSNDHADFRSISIVPTMDEILCDKRPFLPTPVDTEWSHLERQFRLLRHDMVAGVTEAVTSLESRRKMIGNEHDRKDSGKDLRTAAWGGGGGPKRLLLSGAKRSAVFVDKRGRGISAIIMHFDWPHQHCLSRMNPKRRIEYLQSGRGGCKGSGGEGRAGAGRNLLKQGSLVVLLNINFQPMLLARVAIRDEIWLAGRITEVKSRSTDDDGAINGFANVGRGSGTRNRFKGGDSRKGRTRGRGKQWHPHQGSNQNEQYNGDKRRPGSDKGGKKGWGGDYLRPAVGLSFFRREDVEIALQLSKSKSWGFMIPLDTSIFSYESVLKTMQAMPSIPMGDLLVDWCQPASAIQEHKTTDKKKGRTVPPPAYGEIEAAAVEAVAVQFSPTPTDLKNREPLVLSPSLPGVQVPAGCQFDISQRVAVAQVLRERVSLIQGPPGTGKTFLGVLLAQILLSLTKEKILCVCYTNHALDSLLEDMISKGVNDIVRIGGGSKNPKLESCQLRNLTSTGFDTAQGRQYARLKQAIADAAEDIKEAERDLDRMPSKQELVQWLEDEDQDAFDDLSMPAELQAIHDDGETVVGRKSRALTGTMIINSWLSGSAKPQGTRYSQSQSWNNDGVWALDTASRREVWESWNSGFKRDNAVRLAGLIAACDADTRELAELEMARDIQRVKQARVVGCTTTGAAIYHALVSEAECGVMLVEEAAEVLEAHVLTALTPSTKHFIMIGDHKQLRPKVEQYELRLESRQGLNLDISLFERLATSGYPHTTLELQHRMPPKVSALVRGLTYPGLRDGLGTLSRPDLQGVRDRVCFVVHNHAEEVATSMRQRQEEAGSASKVNCYEVAMVAKTAEYLMLQGYEPDQMVVLTPYLAQLRVLRDALDGTVSDQDAADLTAAVKKGEGEDQGGQEEHWKRKGASEKERRESIVRPRKDERKMGGKGLQDSSKSRIRVATVDNYQGEESDIIIGSFVRSNESGSMGFIGDPNRLNVAISRARHGMILFGDLDFFTSDTIKNKSGQRLWLGFKSLLEAGGHIYRDGLPIICETHNTRVDLPDPVAFDRYSPDGGCQLLCEAKLACGHICPRRCHPRDDKDHERGSESCIVTIDIICSKGHTSKRKCQDPTGLPCPRCESERLAAEREAKQQETAKRCREEQRDEAAARLAAARRAAATEREKLAHGLGLLRLERAVQQAEVNADEARASTDDVQARLDGVRAKGGGDSGSGNGAPASRSAKEVRKDIDHEAKKRGDELSARFEKTPKPSAKSNSAKAGESGATGANNNSNSARTTVKPPVPQNNAKSRPSSGLPVSTLRLVAQAAAKGNASGILKALEAIPETEQERASQELALAIGETAVEWFPPYGGGKEPQPISTPTGRIAQAMYMMSKGEWVNARCTLAAVVKEGENNQLPPASIHPHVVFALALCDFHLAGPSKAKELLAKLEVAERELWSGPPDGATPPTARAFPLRALVRATLEAERVVSGSADPPTDGDLGASGGARTEENGEVDPRVQACASAIAFLRVPAPARNSGGVDGDMWEKGAEAVVRKVGRDLSVALWGPEGSGGNGTGNDEDGKKSPGERVETEWRKLKSRWGVTSSAMEELLEMSGLDAIKLRFLNIAQSVMLDKERGYDCAERSYNIRLEGNPGTGKTTVARLYYLLLKEIGVFEQAEEKARQVREEEEKVAREKAAAAEKVRQDTERRAFQSAGFQYKPSPAPSSNIALAPAPAPAPTPGSAQEKAMLYEGFVETTGADLANNGVGGLKKMLQKIRDAGGGMLFVDEAYTLEPKGGGGGKQVLNYLLAEIENRRGELVVAFAGYAKDMESLFEYNEGLPSRFPETLRFADYSDDLLLGIFKGLIKNKKGRGTLRLAPGPAGQGERWAKVAIARLGRRRGTRGFGNARAVRVLFDRVLQRQTDRLSCASGDGDDNNNGDNEENHYDLDPFVLTKPDLLGVTVAELDDSASWRELKDMIGLGKVKDSVKALAEVVKTNVVLEEDEKPPRAIALNRCMLGNPGTGKTTVAKLFAGILADLGLLSKGEVVLKTASDFVGSVIGESESKTRAILKASEGCVLVIDEAYSLGGGGGISRPGGGNSSDPFRVAVVDTLVEQVQNVPGEDRCVLLLGYCSEMEEFMRNTNPGLARRFALDNAFLFDDYTDEELLSILRGKLAREQLTANVDALVAASGILRKKRGTDAHFGNGGAVANLLSEAKLRKERRRGSDGSIASRLDPELLPPDFDPEYGVCLPDGAALEEDLFGDLIGCRDIKAQLSRIRSTFLLAEKLGRDPRETINLNFRFTGAPGTGKTTVAQRVGRMFRKLGVLHSDDVVSCSPSDFQTGYIGQAGRKTKDVMDKAIGKVLFIDEAYGLNPKHGGGTASFMHEAVDQIVQCLTDDKYKGNMVCIVAGYAEEIDQLMDTNPGLASRFPETLHFPNFGVEDCCRLLESKLKRDFSTELAPDVVGIGTAQEGSAVLRDIMSPLLQAPRFGNGRTITDLAKRIFTEIGVRVESGGGRQLDPRASANDIRCSTTAVLRQMSRVSKNASAHAIGAHTRNQPVAFSSSDQSAPPPPKTTVSRVTTTESGDKHEKDEDNVGEVGMPDVPNNSANDFLSATDLKTLAMAMSIAGIAEDSPDINSSNPDLRRALLLPLAAGGVGLSVEATESLLQGVSADRRALARAKHEESKIDKENVSRVNKVESEAVGTAEAVATAIEKGADKETIHLLEALKRAKEEALKKAKEERERRLAFERAVQATLARMSACVVGYKWIQQGDGGWRCAGGSHFVSRLDVATEMARSGST